MADSKISALPAATVPLAGTEVLPIVQSSTTKQVSVANLTAGRAISASSITNSALTSGRITYAGASGLLTDSANLTWDGSTLVANGNLFVGTTSSSGGYFCTVGNNAKFGWTNLPNTATAAVAGFYNSLSVNVGTITTDAVSTAFNTTSDYRLKENVMPMTGALATVAQLKPVTYKWITNGADGQGFIAHELAEVVPDCVTGEKDAVYDDGKPKYQGIDTSYLVATLTAAIQELNDKFEEYKASHP